MPVNLPTNLLRSFVAIVDTGSMLSASGQVFVTQSALSLQIKRLEELVQQSLFSREGRRLVLTPAGEGLLAYSRRILTLHDEAVASVSAGRFAGPVRIGMVQDFAERLFAGVLGQFHELHPESYIYARVGGTADLQAALEREELDIVVGFGAPNDPSTVSVTPTRWFGEPSLLTQEPLSLALLEKPCRFRESAISALEASGKSYRITVETPNLSTLRAAVQANLGVTCRTQLFSPDMPPLPVGVPTALPDVGCVIRTRKQSASAATRLTELLEETLRAPTYEASESLAR